MFRKLRNRFIWMTMLATTLIVVVTFGLVYMASAMSMRPNEVIEVPREFREGMNEGAFREAIREEREKNLAALAINLVVAGLCIEVVMLVVSYLYAEKSIEPVKQAYEQQRDFIANASHELKTPIAAIRANFEALEATDEPWSSNIDAELTHANQLVLDLLTLARTDDVAQEQRRQKSDLAELVRKRASVLEPRLVNKTMSLAVPDKLNVETYVAQFEQILDILLDNAAKYAKTRIGVELTATKLTVRNDGKTISAEKLAKIFDRFYQVDKSTSGTGLGLAIAKAVAEKCHWKLTASSAKGEIEFCLKYR